MDLLNNDALIIMNQKNNKKEEIPIKINNENTNKEYFKSVKKLKDENYEIKNTLIKFNAIVDVLKKKKINSKKNIDDNIKDDVEKAKNIHNKFLDKNKKIIFIQNFFMYKILLKKKKNILENQNAKKLQRFFKKVLSRNKFIRKEKEIYMKSQARKIQKFFKKILKKKKREEEINFLNNNATIIQSFFKNLLSKIQNLKKKKDTFNLFKKQKCFSYWREEIRKDKIFRESLIKIKKLIINYIHKKRLNSEYLKSLLKIINLYKENDYLEEVDYFKNQSINYLLTGLKIILPNFSEFIRTIERSEKDLSDSDKEDIHFNKSFVFSDSDVYIEKENNLKNNELEESEICSENLEITDFDIKKSKFDIENDNMISNSPEIKKIRNPDSKNEILNNLKSLKEKSINSSRNLRISQKKDNIIEKNIKKDIGGVKSINEEVVNCEMKLMRKSLIGIKKKLRNKSRNRKLSKSKEISADKPSLNNLKSKERKKKLENLNKREKKGKNKRSINSINKRISKKTEKTEVIDKEEEQNEISNKPKRNFLKRTSKKYKIHKVNFKKVKGRVNCWTKKNQDSDSKMKKKNKIKKDYLKKIEEKLKSENREEKKENKKYPEKKEEELENNNLPFETIKDTYYNNYLEKFEEVLQSESEINLEGCNIEKINLEEFTFEGYSYPVVLNNKNYLMHFLSKLDEEYDTILNN